MYISGQGPAMPEPLEAHAIAAVNASTFIISGGRSNTNIFSPVTWYFNHVTQEFQQGPSLMEERVWHVSGTVVDHQTNENIVVVAGGACSYCTIGGILNSTELLINGEWQQGKNHAKQ